MRANIIRIGNSQGIRLPKVILEQSRLGKEVDLEVEDEKIIIRRASYPREDWENQFRLMAENGDDQVLDTVQPDASRWDEDEWVW
ncbi:MAG: AbrB/MazE/SpoVT family DNA-binding domain-containing protein [Smithella sp.]|jgi:antitoxin MazE